MRDIPKEELMDTISFVFQNSRLLKGSILDNVRLGRAQATEAEVLAALKAAQCMDIVEKFPAGIHTVIGTKGVYLSGGEQQRVAVARAMVNRPPLLICDEPTGNLDPAISLGIMKLLERINRTGTTVIVATHDREMVDSMHRRVIALEGGHVIRDQERGGYGNYGTN